MKTLNHPRSFFSRRTPVWAVLLVWILAIGAPCAHCVAMGLAEPAPAATPALSAADEAMLAGMPADCPMHQALAAAKAKDAAPEEKAPCDQPADCCLERGGMPAAEEDFFLPAPSAPAATSFAPVAALAVFAPPAISASAGEPRFERSHAPPSFSIPLRT